MKIALIGYGKMGKTIERIALERGHEIVSVIDIDNLDDFESDAFKSADVAIEFTVPKVALSNYRRAFAAGVAVVSGTTGWTDELPALKKEIDETGKTLFWSSNFSLGVNIFMAVNKYLAAIMNQFPNYNVEMTEVHHTQKLDAPSGTAITLADGILENLNRKTGWVKETETKPEEMAIKSIREGQVPGIHTIRYESEVDSIEITHDAKSREGFALGAVVAAEFTAGKKGLLGMGDMLKF
ncbi:dihydrodipicolinate reductase [Paludibacter propionicigenes WB4]|uniref:4-hydroxy-tetrahydrodipicolinate reductase n=1 Tax=Paludibacter propionicigenes (strain DSM 17365 / JCM 13257 / WB4) TaxID=694427 RepID=E4T4L6_PALPW|nr:4-hydroxy-tetrahydrodipicolinate reductase [Paludibacter propionicigenes]ADQ79660.1 dihydrodipicolinate reductase [Paludibacter propionicigenes WB4]